MSCSIEVFFKLIIDSVTIPTAWCTQEKQGKRNETKRNETKRNDTLFLLCERVFLLGLFTVTREKKKKNGHAILSLLFLVFLETLFLLFERFVKHKKRVYEKQPISDRGNDHALSSKNLFCVRESVYT